MSRSEVRKPRGKHVVAGLMLLALLAFAISACGGGGSTSSNEEASAEGASTEAAESSIDSSKPPWRIPVISIKIPGLDLLTPNADGAKAAADKINAEGGFEGREVVIEECATQLTPQTATVCANQTLEKEEVLAEIGCEISWPASGLKIYEKAEIPSFNCVNEVSNEWNFGAHPGALGEDAGGAQWLCEQSDIHTVSFLGQDLPSSRKEIPAGTEAILKGCGKEVHYVYAPLETTDFTPFVNKVLEYEPDFVMTFQSPAPTVQMLKVFQQAGWPAEKISVPDSSCNYQEVLKVAGSLAEGMICTGGFTPWGEEGNPEIAEYKEAVESSGVGYDYRSSSVQWGYSGVMWIYEAAKKIGFSELTPVALAEFMRTETGVPVPLSKEWINPGPASATSIKMPFVNIAQWKNGELALVDEGTEEGWINAFKVLEEAKGGA